MDKVFRQKWKGADRPWQKMQKIKDWKKKKSRLCQDWTFKLMKPMYEIYILRLEHSKSSVHVPLSLTVSDAKTSGRFLTPLPDIFLHMALTGLKWDTDWRGSKSRPIWRPSKIFIGQTALREVSLTSLTPLRLLIWEQHLSAPRPRPQHCFKCQDLIQDVFKICGWSNGGERWNNYASLEISRFDEIDWQLQGPLWMMKW